MVPIKHRLGELDVFLDPRTLLPRNRQHPVEIVPHHGRFGGHLAHVAQLLQLRIGLFARFLGELGLANTLFQLNQLITAVIGFAEFLLNGLHLLIQIILALGLLHLPLDAVADALLDLKNADLAFHEAVDALEPLVDRLAFEQFLLLGDLQRQMGSNGVRQLCRVFDLIDRNQNLRRNLLVQLDILLELGDHGAGKRLLFRLFALFVDHRLGESFEEIFIFLERGNARALNPLDQNLDGSVRKFQQLQHGSDRANGIDVLRRRIVVRSILLSHQKDLLVVLHHVFEGAHRFVAADEKRDDHMRKDNDVTQRKDGETRGACLLHQSFNSLPLCKTAARMGKEPGNLLFRWPRPRHRSSRE